MHLWGVAWWLLLGMFGFGAAVGFCACLLLARKWSKPVPGDFGAGCWGLIAGIGLTVVATPLAGIVAVVLTFAMHSAGWDRPLPFLAGIGFVFLALVAGWLIRVNFGKRGP